MKKIFFFLTIFFLKELSNKTEAFKIKSFKRKLNVDKTKERHLNEPKNDFYSFLMEKKDHKEEKEDRDHNDSQKKSDSAINSSDKRNEDNDSNEKKREEENSNEKSNDENGSKRNEKYVPIEKKINKENLLEYGSHDKDGNFIPSYKTLTDEILSTNNSLEKSSSFLKISCSHVLKILEFIPESKLSSHYIKVESKTVYLKDIGNECQNIYFSLNKLIMSVIVLNSKVNKLIYQPEK